jgi:hypothetical protein
MEKLIKQLEKEISKALKEKTKLLKKGDGFDGQDGYEYYDMDNLDSIIYYDDLIAGLERAIELLNNLNK